MVPSLGSTLGAPDEPQDNSAYGDAEAHDPSAEDL